MVVDDGLSRLQHSKILQARRALAERLEELSGPGEMMVLAMVAYAGGFSDMLTAGADSGGAKALVEVTNRQLYGAGWQLVPIARN